MCVRIHKIIDGHSFKLYNLDATVDSSTFVQSVENLQHNVDVCINSTLVKTTEKNRQNLLLCQVYFILWLAMPTTQGIHEI